MSCERCGFFFMPFVHSSFSYQFSAISSSTKAKILGCNVDDVLNDYLQYIFALFVHELAKSVSFFLLFPFFSFSLL